MDRAQDGLTDDIRVEDINGRAGAYGLADDLRPAGSFPYGSPDRRRLRIGRYRVMYDITAETVSVWHLGRSRAGS